MKIVFPKIEINSMSSLESAILKRESIRDYLDTALALSKLSQLLFAAQGRRGSGSKLVTPSAQEQYPISLYVVSATVDDLAPGLYQYEKNDHSINRVKHGDFSTLLETAAIGEQPWIGNAAAILVLAADIRSMNQQFADQPPVNSRGERYCYIEVGAIAQNVQLMSAGLGVGMVLVGGFDNSGIKNILQLPEGIEPAAMLCIGNI